MLIWLEKVHYTNGEEITFSYDTLFLPYFIFICFVEKDLIGRGKKPQTQERYSQYFYRLYYIFYWTNSWKYSKISIYLL